MSNKIHKEWSNYTQSAFEIGRERLLFLLSKEATLKENRFILLWWPTNGQSSAALHFIMHVSEHPCYSGSSAINLFQTNTQSSPLPLFSLKGKSLTNLLTWLTRTYAGKRWQSTEQSPLLATSIVALVHIPPLAICLSQKILYPCRQRYITSFPIWRNLWNTSPWKI